MQIRSPGRVPTGTGSELKDKLYYSRLYIISQSAKNCSSCGQVLVPFRLTDDPRRVLVQGSLR